MVADSSSCTAVTPEQPWNARGPMKATLAKLSMPGGVLMKEVMCLRTCSGASAGVFGYISVTFLLNVCPASSNC